MFSKPNTLKSHNLKNLIDRVLSSLAPEAHERKVEFFLDHDLEDHLEVFLDPQALETELVGMTKKILLSTADSVLCFQVKILEIFEGKARFYFEIKSTSLPVSLDSLTLDLEFLPRADGKIEKRYPRIFLEQPVLVLADRVLNQLEIRQFLARHQIKSQIISNIKSLAEVLSKDHFSALLSCLSSSEIERVKPQLPLPGSVKIPVIETLSPSDPEVLAQRLRLEVQPLLSTQMILKLSGYKMEGKSLLRVLADDYFQAAPNLFLQLAQNIRSGNVEKTQYFAHRLKSSSLILGLVGISSYCEKLELLKDLEQGSKILLEIEGIFEKSRSLLLNFLDNSTTQS